MSVELDLVVSRLEGVSTVWDVWMSTSPSSIPVYVPTVVPDFNLIGWLVGFRQRTIRRPFSPGWFKLVAMGGPSTCASISPSGQ